MFGFTRNEALLTFHISLFLSAPSAAYDLPVVNLGATSFADGSLPSGPGWYFQEYLQFYDTDKLADSDGNALYLPTRSGLKKHQVSAFAAVTQLTYQFDTPQFTGGKWAVQFLVPLIHREVSPGDSLALQANSTGFGDLTVGSFFQWDPVMGPDHLRINHSIGLQFILPTGKYDEDHALNPGSNHFSFNPYWAGTTFLGSNWTASWRLHYLWNATNENPSESVRKGIQRQNPEILVSEIKPGQAFHANFAATYNVLPRRLMVGLNGYYLNQLTNTEVDGQEISGRKEEVFAIGPGLLWHFSSDTHLFANLYFETSAKNRPKGNKLNLRLTHHF